MTRGDNNWRVWFNARMVMTSVIPLWIASFAYEGPA